MQMSKKLFISYNMDYGLVFFNKKILKKYIVAILMISVNVMTCQVISTHIQGKLKINLLFYISNEVKVVYRIRLKNYER